MKFLNSKWTFIVVTLFCILVLVGNYNFIRKLKQNSFDFGRLNTTTEFIFSYFSQPITKLDEIFMEKIDLFKSIIANECDPRNFTLKSTCLSSLKQFDVHLLNLRAKNINVTNGCDKCLNFVNSETNSITQIKVLYHTFWNLNNRGSTVRMVNLNILSYLATQNLCCSKMYIWVLEGNKAKFESFIDEKLQFSLKNGFLEVKEFTIVEFCQSGFFKQNICANLNTSMGTFHMISLSDLIRFAVLDKYGGINVKI
jgi:hypothetical protein